MAFVDATIVNIAFPDIGAVVPRDASIATLSWVLNAYNIVFAAFLVAAGRVGGPAWAASASSCSACVDLHRARRLLCAVAPSR